MNHRKSGNVALAVLLTLLFLSVRLHSAQAIDPFYLKLFQDGEASFQARDFTTAVKELEIALFGLSADRKKAAKAYIYLSLSYRVLKNRDLCRQFLSRAITILGEEGPDSLGLDAVTLNDYVRLVEDFRIAPGATPGKQNGVARDKAAEPAAQKIRRPVESSRVRELETRLKASPDEASIQYELVSLYFEQKNYRKIISIMEGVLKKHPKEVLAVFHLARARFFQKEYRRANYGFHEVISPSSENQITKNIVLLSTIYLTLCLHELGQKASLVSYLDDLSQNIPPAELNRILAEEDLTERWTRLKAQNAKTK